MTNIEYTLWVESLRGRTAASLLRGTRDPIILIGYPVNYSNRYIEGIVIWSNTSEHPRGKASAGWIAEAFELLPDADFEKVLQQKRMRTLYYKTP